MNWNNRVILLGVVLVITLLSVYVFVEAAAITEPRTLLRSDVSMEDVAEFYIEPLNREELLAEDAVKTDRPRPYRVAKPIGLDIRFEAIADWTLLDGEDLLWRVKFYSPGAMFLSVKLSNFYLPMGVEVHFYSVDKEYFEGPYTDRHNRESRRFGSPMIPGESVIMEVFVPRGVREPDLVIESVSYGYRNALDITSIPWRKGSRKVIESSGVKAPDTKAPYDCQRDINCPEGAPYQVDKRAVAQGYDGAYICTGTVINNVRQDCRYLYITADHCEWWLDASAMTYYWWYENSGCDTGDAGWDTSSGSTELFHSDAMDIDLLELSGTDLENIQQIYFSGWSRDTATPPSMGAIMSFPSDKPRQIAIDNHPIIDCAVASCPNGWGGNWWRLDDYEVGVTEGGSSGGGLLDENHRLRGVLTGGVGSSCTNFDWDEYGKLSAAWASIQQYLDPDNTGAVFINGKDYPDCGCDLEVDVTPDNPATSCLGDSLVLTANLTGGNGPFTFQWTEGGVDLSDGGGISGSDTDTLTVQKSVAQSFAYNCKVSDSQGCVAVVDTSDVTATWQACGPYIAYNSTVS